MKYIEDFLKHHEFKQLVDLKYLLCKIFCLLTETDMQYAAKVLP